MSDDAGFDLAAFLEACGLGHLLATFRREAVDGDIVGDLTDDDLRELGLTLGDRKRFRRALETARARSRAPELSVQQRNLTVLFCDLVNSTVLANSLDREDYVDFVRTFITRCSAAVVDAGGTVAKYTGDGLMAYFGYPTSHDNEASRAVTAGLAIQSVIRDLDRLSPESVGARVGIASGLAIVGHVLGDEDIVDALGNTPTLAARIEGAAEVGTVFVSDLTRRLAADDFEFADCGLHPLKGFDQPVRLHRAVRPARSRIMFDDFAPPVVGRRTELAQLLELAASAAAGSPHFAIVEAEPGVGKSALVRALGAQARVEGWHAVPLACHEHELTHHGHPIRHLAAAAAGIEPTDSPEEQQARYVELARRLGVRDERLLATALVDAASTSPADRRRALFDVVGDVIAAATATGPTLIVVEDVHWADPTTIDLIAHATRIDAPLLIVATSRPTDEPTALEPDLHLQLERLDEDDARTLVHEALGDEVDESLVRTILERSDGVPLFIEELAQHILDETSGSAGLREGESWPADAVPATLHDTLMARLDRLPAGGKVAPIAATLGRRFPAGLVAAVAGDVELDRGLEELIEARLLERVDGDYVFRHALIQDIAYGRMVRVERHRVHRRVADVLTTHFPEQAADAPHRVAHHLESSDTPELAIPWWQRSAERAARHSANPEVVAASDRALALLVPGSDDDDRLRHELAIQLLRAGALRGTAGFAAEVTGTAYRRARELSERLDDLDALFVALNGEYSFHLVRDEYDLAGRAANALLALSERSGVAQHGVVANRAVGAAAFHTGHFEAAERHLSRSIELYRSGDFAAERFVYGTDHATTAACFLALTLWVVGRDEDSDEIAEWATEHATALDHVHSWAQVATYRCFLAVMGRRWESAVELGGDLLARSEEHGLTLMAITARFWQATGRYFLGDTDQLDAMHRAADEWWHTGARSYLGFRNTLLAEAHAAIGDAETGLELIRQALERVELTGETWALAETHRIRARLLAAEGNPEAALGASRRAIEIADEQGALAWRRRAEAGGSPDGLPAVGRR